MKILGSILIIFVFSLFGIIKAGIMRKRYINILGIKESILMLETEVMFLKNNLDIAMRNVAEGTGKKIFLDCAINMQNMSVDEAWKKSLLDNSEKLYLNARDVSVMSKLSAELGKTDCENQVRHIRYVGGLVDELYDSAVLEYKEKHKLYQSSGLALGIFLVLVMI